MTLADPKFISLTTIQVGKKIKDKQERVFGSALVTIWFTLADRRWRSRYRSSDQCIFNTFRSPERYNGWFREQLGQHLPPWLSRLRVAIRRRKCPTIQQKNEWTQKWPYEKDALARESTLCVAGALVGWLWQIKICYHWPQSKFFILFKFICTLIYKQYESNEKM
jgi:hypothetical protein